MENFESKKELIKSLVFPVVSFLWGAAGLERDFLRGTWGAEFNGKYAVFLIIYIAAVLGGIVAALLTLLAHVNTSRYFFKRLVIVGIVFVMGHYEEIFKNRFIPLPISVVLIVAIACAVYEVIRVWDNKTTVGERVVLILSDPIIYWSLYWAAFIFIFYPY